MYLGWVLLLALIIVTSIPPLLGYGTCITLCGFAFGIWKGWLIAAAGCLCGGLLSFMFVFSSISNPKTVHSDLIPLFF